MRESAPAVVAAAGIPVLITLLRAPTVEVQERAAWALAALAAADTRAAAAIVVHGATPLLTTLSRSTSAGLRKAAAAALEQLGRPRSDEEGSGGTGALHYGPARRGIFGVYICV